MNDEIEKVHTWLASNKLTLNISKSKFMIISNKKAIPRNFTVAINGENLEKCTSYKYLGIIFDEKLNWKEHISYVCGKVASACGALAKLRHCVNTNILKEFYHALSYSYIRYGLIVWGNALPTTLKPLQALMNRAARIITFSPFGHIDMKPIYECLEILDLKNAFLLETSKFVFKQKKGLLPVPIGNHFENYNPVIHDYNLRNGNAPSLNFRLPSSEERSIKSRGQKLWNQIPTAIRNCGSSNSFKKRLKAHLIIEMKNLQSL